jgi:hypothetical protein
LKIGIYSAWNKQVYNPAITLALNDFIEKIKIAWSRIIEIDIPDLEEVRIAHIFNTIGSELFTIEKFS